jgi:hypothetical protein
MSIYDTDVAVWAAEQAALLRQRSFNHLDLDNLAEEIEDLGKSQRRALRSQIGRIVEHLLKLQFSPAKHPVRGWEETVDDARREVELVLDDSPSLRREIGEVIATETVLARRRVLRLLARYDELTAEVATQIGEAVYSDEEVLSDWRPEPR